MTFDRLYTADEFRLANCVWFGNHLLGSAYSCGHYESIQLCSNWLGQSDRPQGIYGIGFGNKDQTHQISYSATFVSARFLYASLVLGIAHRRVAEQFPDWLDHRWTLVEPGWRKIEFTSSQRETAELLCERLVREIANSGEVSVQEQSTLDFCDFMGNAVATAEESRNSGCEHRRLFLVANVPEMNEHTETRFRMLYERGESFVPLPAILRFVYDDIAPFFISLNPWLLSLVNAEEGRPPATNMDRQLFDAVERLDINRAVRLVAQGADINALNDEGETPLTKLAAASNFDFLPCEEADEARRNQPDLSQDERIDMMRRLLELGADVNLFGYEGFSPLTAAVLRHEDEVVLFLLKEGADPNHSHFHDEDPEEVSTAMYYASNDLFLVTEGSEEEKRLTRICDALKDAGVS